MLKYRTRVSDLNYNFIPEIEPIEIESETRTYVFLPCGTRQKKITDYHCYFESKKEAVSYIKEAAKIRIESRKRDIRNKQNDIIKLENIIKAVENE